MSNINPDIPVDAHNNPIDRAMALPVVIDDKYLGQSTSYVDIADLTAYGDNRAFTGISIRNPDTALDILVAIGAKLTAAKCIRVAANSVMTFDEQFFGPAAQHKVLRAKLASSTSGTLATGTFNYDNTGVPVNPSNGDTVTIDGTVYEFSNDLSVVAGRVKVDIKASADLTWSELVAVVNAAEEGQGVTLSINTGTNIVTVTSNYGGTTGNAITIAAIAALVTAGVVVSGAALGSGANGVLPTFHIW